MPTPFEGRPSHLRQSPQHGFTFSNVCNSLPCKVGAVLDTYLVMESSNSSRP